MYKVKKILFLAIFLTYSFPGFSQIQPTLPPSPTASALAKYVDNPVSHYTGTPNISIPLYEIELKDFKLPISLSYNPQDIQVATVASNVGLGWSLNAGGVITRAVRDWHDDGRLDYNPEDPNHGFYDNTDLYMHHAQQEFPNPFTKWGYYHAKALSEPIVQGNGIRYFGTSTYNLDLFSIYNNRTNVSPLDAILGQFGNHLPGAITGTTGEYDISGHLQLTSANFRTMHADMEPDIFYFNFAGYSGKFVFDVEGSSPKIRTIPYQNLDITEIIDQTSGALIGFTVIDDKGNTFLFEDVETSRIFYDNLTLTTFGKRNKYNSAWYLSSITTPTGGFINFSYDGSDIVFDIKTLTLAPSFSRRRLAVDDNDPTQLNEGLDNSQLQITFAKRLKTITASNGAHVDLKAGHERQDLLNPGTGTLGYDVVAKAITSIEIYHRPTSDHFEKVKKYVFDYDYFSSTEEKSGRFWLHTKNDGQKRLRLNSLTEFGNNNKSLPPYVFSYNYYDDNGSTTDIFPNKYSFNLDLWGYSNGANNVTPVPSFHIYPDKYLIGDLGMFSIYEKSDAAGRHYTTPGGNRRPNANYMDIGVLNKITYPTGGYTEYFFEPHDFILDGEKEIGGGLRITKIIKDDAQGSAITYRYKYTKSRTDNTSSGKIVTLPMYAMSARSFDYSELTEYEFKTEFNTFSYSIAELGRTAGSNIGYTNVIEYISPTKDNYPNGYTEFKFSFPAAFGDDNDLPVALHGDCTIDENGICDSLYRSTIIHNFFLSGANREIAEWEGLTSSGLTGPTAPNPNYDWNRGLLLYKKVYDKDYDINQEHSYQYDNYYPYNGSSPTKIYGIKLFECSAFTEITDDPGDVYPFRVIKYEINTDVSKVLTSKTTTDYGATTANSISKTVEYSYGGVKHADATRVEEETSTSDKLITTYKYAADYLVTGFDLADMEGVYALNSKNMSSEPVEVSKYIQKEGAQYLTSSKITIYDLEDSIPVPIRIKEIQTNELISDFNPSNTNNPVGQFVHDLDYYTENVHVLQHDDRGNPLEVKDQTTGITTSYIWGYKNQYPIAKVVNATYSEIEGVLSSSSLSILSQGYKYGPPGPGESFPTQIPLTDQEVRDRLAPLQAGLSDAQVNLYTYKPLVGLTSETGINGRVIYYEYDNFNRLEMVKDHDENILKQYEYYYKD